MSVSSHPAQKKPLLNDGTYNVLKHVAQVGLPAAEALYFGLSQIWNLPDTTQVVSSLAVVNTALGALLGYSTVTYNNSDAKYAGVIEVVEDEAKKIFSLNLHQDPADLEKMATATFRVASVLAQETGFALPENPPTLGH